MSMDCIEYPSTTSCCQGDEASGSKQNYTRCFSYVQIATESKLFSSKVAFKNENKMFKIKLFGSCDLG